MDRLSGTTQELTGRQTIHRVGLRPHPCEPGQPSHADLVLIGHTILHRHPDRPVEPSGLDRDQETTIEVLRAAFPARHPAWAFVEVVG